MPKYPLESSVTEYDRLELQGEMYSWITLEFFEGAFRGRTPKSILDVGCGVGKVTQELLTYFGKSAEIVGIDTDRSVIDYATTKFATRGINNVSFRCGDWVEEACTVKYDLIVGRFILMYSESPFETARRLCESLSPGTLIAFQEADHRQHMRTLPPSDVFKQYALALENAAKARGVHVSLGLQLEQLMREAGLQIQSTHRAGRVDSGADSQIYRLLSSTIGNMKGAIEKERNSGDEIRKLEAALRDEAAKSELQIFSSVLVGVCGKVPGRQDGY